MGRTFVSGNALIAQSGGPTVAINATLSGVVKGLREDTRIGKIFGAKNGVEGILAGRIEEIGSRLSTEDTLYALERTPAAVLGSCRIKMPPPEENKDIYDKIITLFREYDIRYFFLIGGNDSMDTASKIYDYSKSCDWDIRIIGVPKTIDNDLAFTDHTPGFGSAAKYIATTVQEIARDCAVYTVKAVTVIETMGRDAGWLTAAAGVPSLYGHPGADLLYMPEVPFDYDKFENDVRRIFKTKPNVVVVVPEALQDANGEYVSASTQSGAVDIFGHKYLAGTGRALEHFIRERIGCKFRAVELSIPQRCAGHCASKTDIDESVLIGRKSAQAALNGKTGVMTAFVRDPGSTYSVHIETVPLSQVANVIKQVPKNFLTADGGVKREILEYIAPLIEGELDIPTEHGLPKYITL